MILGEDGKLNGVLAKAVTGPVEIQELAVVRRECARGPLIFLGWVFRFLQAILRIAFELVKKDKPNVVYVNTLALLTPVIAARFVGVPSVSHIHEIVVRPRALARILYSLNAIFSTRIILVSHAVLTHYRAHLPTPLRRMLNRKARVIHNGIPGLSRSSLRGTKKADDVIILMVGRIHFWKGQDYLLDAAVELRRRSPEVFAKARWLIVGDPFRGYEHLERQLREKVCRYGMQETVEFLGFRRDVPELMATSDILVVPSILPDPFPTVILEGLRAGLPVVATSEGGASEMITDHVTGRLVPSDDATRFADVLCELISSSADRLRLASNAAEHFKKNFTVERYQKEMLGSFAPYLKPAAA